MSKKMFTWEANSDDGCFTDRGGFFDTQDACYAEMMNRAIDKMKWNVEYDDVLSDSGAYEKDGVMFTNGEMNAQGNTVGENWGVEYRLLCHPHMIQHYSGSGLYTYKIKIVEFADDEVKQIDSLLEWALADDADGIHDVTQAYTVCKCNAAWEKVVEKWEEAVPCHEKLHAMIAENPNAVYGVHKRIKAVADEINAEIAKIEAVEQGGKYVDHYLYVMHKDGVLYNFNLESQTDADSALECLDHADAVCAYIYKADDPRTADNCCDGWSVPNLLISIDEARQIAKGVWDYFHFKSAK